jgi:hypothetical protein
MEKGPRAGRSEVRERVAWLSLLCVTSRAHETAACMRPFRDRSRPPCWPWRTATTSARIDSAASSSASFIADRPVRQTCWCSRRRRISRAAEPLRWDRQVMHRPVRRAECLAELRERRCIAVIVVREPQQRCKVTKAGLVERGHRVLRAPPAPERSACTPGRPKRRRTPRHRIPTRPNRDFRCLAPRPAPSVLPRQSRLWGARAVCDGRAARGLVEIAVADRVSGQRDQGRRGAGLASAGHDQ